MKVYETNAGLGYMEKAYLIKTGKLKYLCIGGENLRYDYSSMYSLGEEVEFLEDSYIEESDYKLEKSELRQLCGAFIFDFFIKNNTKT